MKGHRTRTSAREQAPRILVVGVCGGAGTTLLAAALALALVEEDAKEVPGVLLADLDYGHGDLGVAWGGDAVRSVEDLGAVGQELGWEHIERATHLHPSGIHVLAAGGRPGAPLPRQRTHRSLLMAVAGRRVAVVADGGRGGVDLRALAAAATSLVLVCPGTVGAARRASCLAGLLVERDLDDRSGLVLAHGPLRRRAVGSRALSAAVGLNVVGELPWSPAEAEALGSGARPQGRRRPLWDAVSSLAGVLP